MRQCPRAARSSYFSSYARGQSDEKTSDLNPRPLLAARFAELQGIPEGDPS
jgi:hypothetical protein